ncbi:hypothetical protein SAMN05661008_00600 [Alkalithermobacter thermoalcaliphilus JW-YL-7 = DSM 7308]|uniref:Uncharacterized protein n=1 Tax=Alkalithermobacter thermoalcaliphilus JW-YL-7 = DSM 7308 TaxID=1121328 RepID=A0A150FQ34_CLOPD|nr:hypothetical protein JWYL7_0797 [[Clostridium] paradoxum JW-YL-7 = DSM 7308]SHK63365.1 hypothetical protein SAMN05661008_00600 [[Clostridium] paradoxum JW-YL-7 = DSM 7308]
MFNKIYEKGEFIIFPIKKGFVVYNMNKEFEQGHTHLKNFNAAKTAIDLVVNKKIPKTTNLYYLKSLIRLAQDPKYIEEIESFINVRKIKGEKQKYYNSPIYRY